MPRVPLTEARAIVESLARMIREHAGAVRDDDGAVSGSARAELNAQADVVDKWTAWLAAHDRLDSATDVELVGLISEIAGAGCQALQVLGAHFANNGKWG